MKHFYNLLAALALIFAALATHSALAYGAVAVGAIDNGAGSSDKLVIEFIVNQPNTGSPTSHIDAVRQACVDAGAPGNTGTGSDASCRGNTGASQRSQTLERQCFGVRAGTQYNPSQQTFNFGPFNLQIIRKNIVWNPNDPALNTDAKAIAAATQAVMDDNGFTSQNLIDLNDFDASVPNNTFVLCDTTPLTTCRAADVAVQGGTTCVFTHDSSTCTTNQYSDGDSCEPCGNINRAAGAAGANCGACLSGYTHASERNAGATMCEHDPDSCGENQFSDSGSCMGSCTDLNRATMAGGECGACQEFFTTDSSSTGTPSADLAGNHDACTFNPNACPNTARADTGEESCVSCSSESRQNRQTGDAATSCGDCLDTHAEDSNGVCMAKATCTGKQVPDSADPFMCADCGDNETNIDNVCACDANSIGEMGSCMACVNGTPNDDADACICDANHNQFANPGAADGCVPNAVCDAPNEILVDEDSRCEACGVNQAPDETGRACQCDSLSYSADGITECQICGDNQVSSEDRTSCMCATDFNDFVNRGMCVQNMDCGNDVATDEGSRCIAFSYIVDDTIEGSGTTEAPYELAFESTGDLQITVSAGGEDLTYSKSGGSDELQVSRDGVVSFTPESEVASGTYNIVIAAIDETTSAELSLYVNVATPVVVKPDSNLQIDNPAVKAAVIAAGLGLIMYIAVNDSVPLFSWTPSYAFNHNNGNTSYSLGSRWTATADNWNFYWQTATGGEEINYGSGVRYQNGLFYAAMDSDSNLEKTDLDISLTANKALGVWRFNGGYNLDAVLSETDTETQNRLNIAAQYTVDRWILSATANTDGETSAARVNYSYRF